MKRECGSCTLCCRLLPVKGIRKPALTRCEFQRTGKGCAVYHKPEKGFPWECGLWNCAWLGNHDAAELRRPDRSHYVIDVMPDYLTAEGADGQKIVIPAVQIWADPKYPNCHRDPELRAWLIRRKGFVGLVRYGAYEAITIIPPYMMANGEWLEKTNNELEKTHSFSETLKALSTVG